MANLMLSVMGAFAEFERALIHERQREGIALAKQRGVYKGRKKSLDQPDVARRGWQAASARHRQLVNSRSADRHSMNT
jgi:DNA invertase Pin-like site-specific DNA recombinase